MIPNWQKGVVLRIEQATHNTRRYWVQLPETPVFDFKPGQFVTLDLPIHEQRNKRWRSYSIAAAPDGSNIIELVIVHSGNGNGSKYIFEHVQEGFELTLRGPQGVFVVPPDLPEVLFLICTGTGIAPFRSMMQHLSKTGHEGGSIHLVYGCRKSVDLLYHDEMRTMEEQLPWFHYHYTFSRELHEGHVGYVHPIYEKLCLHRPKAQFMLCGWKDMVDEARQRIQALGYSGKDIHIEIYG